MEWNNEYDYNLIWGALTIVFFMFVALFYFCLKFVVGYFSKCKHEFINGDYRCLKCGKIVEL